MVTMRHDMPTALRAPRTARGTHASLDALRRLAPLRSRAMIDRLAQDYPPGVQGLVRRWNRPDGIDPR